MALQTRNCNIWTLLETHYLVIPTNIGWKENGENVMGAGLAKQAAKRYPDLPAWYGKRCRKHGAGTPILQYPDAPLILFPVKPLYVAAPWLSWRDPASATLVEISTHQLFRFKPVSPRPVAVPMVGCGNGGLKEGEVRPILEKILGDDPRFLLVLFGN